MIASRLLALRATAMIVIAVALSSCLSQPPLERGIGSISLSSLSTESDSVVRYRVAQSVHRFYTINGQLGRRSPVLQLSRICRYESLDDCAVAASKVKEDSAGHRTLVGSAAAMAAELEQLKQRGATDPSIAEIQFFVSAFIRATPQLRTERPRCDSTPWWCDALDGLARHRTFDTEGAERSFARMFSKMDSATSCMWKSLPEVAGFRCDYRDNDDELMWWLGDPLWLEPGNDRWTEHLSRRVLFELLIRQEDLLREQGFVVADGLMSRQLNTSHRLVRALRWGVFDVQYRNLGPPIPDSQRVAGAFLFFRAHPDRAGTRFSDLAAPHYEFLSFHAPNYREVGADDTSTLAAWPVGAPTLNSCPSDREIRCRRERPGAPPIREHWLDPWTRLSPSYFGSNEAYGRSLRFRTVRDQQVVTLRRDTARELLVAFGTESSPQAIGFGGVAYSAGPGKGVIPLVGAPTRDGAVRVRGMIPNEGGVLSLEAIVADKEAIRHRFYWPADNAAIAGTITASRIVMLTPDPRGLDAVIADELRTGAAAREYPAVDRLLPRVHVRRDEGVELYWEIYGTPADSAPDIALEVRRSDGSVWQAVRSLFGARDGAQVTLEITNPRRVVRTAAHQGYQLTLFPRDLEPGPYELRVLVRRNAQEPYVRGDPSRMVVR